MQLELIGCTSAGKSTLARRLVKIGREHGAEIYLADEFALRQLHLGWLPGQSLRKAFINAAGLLASAVTWKRNRRLTSFAKDTLSQIPMSRQEKLGLMRNVLKKAGISEIVRWRSSSHQIIVFDEGVLQIAHNLFVHSSVAPQLEAIPSFLALISMPDVVVYVRPHESILVERVRERGHGRLAGRSAANVDSFVTRALATFDRLVQEPDVAGRLTVINGARRMNPASQLLEMVMQHEVA